MGVRSEVASITHQPPAYYAGKEDKIALYFEQLKQHEANKVLAGGLIKTPTTSSAQLTGTGNTTWNIDVEAIAAVVGGDAVDIAVNADESIHGGSFLTGFTNGSSCIAAVVLKNVSGTITLVTVKGTPATTGSQVAPTDGEIQTAVGAGNAWIKIAEATLNRTADTTVTESFDNTLRPILGVTVDTDFGSF